MLSLLSSTSVWRRILFTWLPSKKLRKTAQNEQQTRKTEENEQKSEVFPPFFSLIRFFVNFAPE